MNKIICWLIAPVVLVSACSEKKERPNFDAVIGTKFIEVRRAYDTGSSFSKLGFQQKPEWVLHFLPNDSVKIYSPKKKQYIEYPMYYDHDSVFNFAREWFRIKLVSQDSMVLQLLEVNERREILADLSNVYMRFYSERYLKNVLKADPEKLKLPNRFDTLFIRQKSDRANRNPLNPDSAFAGRVPVQFTSLSPTVAIVKQPPTLDALENPDPADEYLYPVYNVSIRKAYKDFYYSYTILVDPNGKLNVLASLQHAEDAAGRLKILQTITDFYIQKNTKVAPATTLGIPHVSKITVNVEGRGE